MSTIQFTPLPKIGSRIAWRELCPNLKPGDVLTLPKKLRHSAPTQLHRNGIPNRSHSKGGAVLIEILAKNPAPPRPEPTPEILTIAKTRARIKEVRENITYWERQKILRTDHVAAVNAGALVLIWKSQLSVLQTKLDALLSKQLITA